MRTLLTTDELHAGVARMAGEITACYESRPLTIVGVLTGSIVLLADLIRLIDLPMRLGVISASGYRGASTDPSNLTVNADLMPDIAGRDVLLVDDIFDTGHTLVQVMNVVSALAPASLRSAVLLRKQGRQEVDYVPDFQGFDIPNEFVVGYGLDYAEMYRNLPYVAALEREDLR